jgi:flagellar motility protein MotE (MotC chaperone)
MKPMLIYAGMFVASLLVAIEIVLLLVPHDQERTVVALVPSHTGKGVPKASRVLRIDSTTTSRDSVAVATRDTVKKEPPASIGLQDSIAHLNATLKLERQKVASLTERAVGDTTRHELVGSKDMKIMAKLLDAMDAQGAAKILQNLEDKHVKEILLTVKKRQAGKILSSLDPERAARIMR